MFMHRNGKEKPEHHLPNDSLPHFDTGNWQDPDIAKALMSLQFLVRKKMHGILHGNYLGILPGLGSELSEHRLYEIGDDVRRIDWNATARTTMTHVRQTIADRELIVWIVVDLTPGMSFGSGGCTKRDMAILGAAIVINMAVREGNPIGAVINNGSRLHRIAPRTGKEHASFVLRTIACFPQIQPADEIQLDTALKEVYNLAHSAGTITVISDFLSQSNWGRTLKTLGSKHSIIAVWILDIRDVQLPSLGQVQLQDPVTGTVRDVFLDTQTVQRYSLEAEYALQKISSLLRSCKAHVLYLRTDREWSKDLYTFIRQYRQVK